MEKKDVLSKILAVLGTFLVWLPLLAPFVFGFFALFSRGRFLFDFLIPAELFVVELAGSLLLLWAAFRAGSQKRWIGWSLAAAIALIFIGQGLAMITGLASGANEAAGWRLVLVMGAIVLFDLALVAVGVGGIRLLRDLFRKE